MEEDADKINKEVEMKLIRDQFLRTKKIDKYVSLSLIVIVIGEYAENALSSLKDQIFTNYRIVYINTNCMEHINSGEIKTSQITQFDIKRRIIEIIEDSDEDYVYLIDGEDTLFPNSLLEYMRYLEKEKCDVVYADECCGDIKSDKVYHYEMKPEFEYMTAFQSLYTGRAVVFSKEKLYIALNQSISNQLDTLLRELFLRCMKEDAKVGSIPLVLLMKEKNERNLQSEEKLLLLVQENIKKFTNWSGIASKSDSYQPFSIRMFAKDDTVSYEFIVIEENLERTTQLLSQIAISYGNKRVIIALYKQDMDAVSELCESLGLINAVFLERKIQYVATLKEIKTQLMCEAQIILSDQVKWINRMNMERLITSFMKPEVGVACPQIATEGDDPRLVYAGGEINSLAFTSNYLKGRTQECIYGYDPAWQSHRVENLTPYCIAIRTAVWDKIFPMHSSISEAWQFAIELSFACKREQIICEYVAQSAFWVDKNIGKWYIKEENKIEVEPQLKDVRKTGNYWHWMSEYGDIIEEASVKMYDKQKSYLRYLRENFKVFGMRYVNETGRKRVLVFSHELSLTGAPLVLVQAVKCLKDMNYDVLIVSPIDGPLRETYLDMEVPVIIEPELYTNFEYIRMVYDFDFVIACTVCLWEVIDALGQTDIPVLWWVHDSRMGYVNWLRYVLPETIGNNIHLYCGGNYAQSVILEYRPRYTSQILLYGLEDFSDKIANTLKRENWNIPSEKIAFANIGQIISRKGQDVLVSAIDRLPDKLLKQSVFIFVGGVVDRKIYNKIMDLQKRYPDNILYIEQMSHDDLKQFYREIDCVICSSVDDPLPAFVAESLMMSRVVICSKNTAFNGIIDDGINGYLFESGDVDKLYENIVKIIEQKDQMQDMRRQARKLFEETFTNTIFEENFKNVIEEVLR